MFFTDGRYTLQASDELDKADYDIFNMNDKQPWEWLEEQAAGKQIGIDPWLFSVAQLKRWKASCGEAKLIELEGNPIDALWGDDRPVLSTASAFEYPLDYAGEARESKIARVAETVKKQKAAAVLLTAPESVMWLLNIRGRDMHYTPILLCRALLMASGEVVLYAPLEKIPAELRGVLGSSVVICSSDGMAEDLKLRGLEGKTVLAHESSFSVAIETIMNEVGATIRFADDPCSLPKAVKNDVELNHIAQTHLTDGRALSKFLQWVEDAAGEKLTELSASDRLEQFRREESNQFIEPSFPTISGFGPNGAIVHYRVTEATDKPLQGHSLYLVDSGGQYYGGTTDVTRTVAVGSPSQEMRENFTRVLKGHIALANVIFPKGTTGAQLDVLARQYLWEDGLDYDHGTGHGVGCFLGVHEGPQGISKRYGTVALQPGMILSNEPGYYKNGEYGIRIENLVVVSELGLGMDEEQTLGFSLHDQQAISKSRAGFYHFRTLTCVPIDERLVVWGMLSEQEKNWFEGYQAWVQAHIG